MSKSLNRPVLVVDDEVDIRDLMEMTLMKMGLMVDTAENVSTARKKINANQYSLILTDMRMPDGSGLEVVQHLIDKKIDTPIAVITAFGNADQAVQALKIGAFDYLQKPITLAQLRTLVKSAIKIQDEQCAPEPAEKVAPAKPKPVVKPAVVEPEAVPVAPMAVAQDSEEDWSAFEATLEQSPPPVVVKPEPVPAPKPSTPPPPAPPVMKKQPALYVEADLPRILGSSPQIAEVRSLIRKLAPANVPIYISGESGSGKEQAARSIHEVSPRKDAPFIAVNCGAIPENLMESEFFGYKKGSFTGADQDRLGFFQHANGGTLFLDEVADLPLGMQVKLLRAIQEKAVRRIGDAKEQQVDVRIISATHKDLEALVQQGHFRQDLFYRLNVISLNMPPLREMRSDLPNLIRHLLQKHHGQSIRMTESALHMLLNYNYPGNFRELENILERAIALAGNQAIDVDDLQINSPKLEGMISDLHHDVTDHHDEPKYPVATDPMPAYHIGRDQIQDYLDDVERRVLKHAMRYADNNRTHAAKLLGISFRSMRYRLERLGIESVQED